MTTFAQCTIRKGRISKYFRNDRPKLEGNPFRRGICMRVYIMKPKKPNSAQRKIAQVELNNGRVLLAYLPGFGHKLSKNSEVMIRGGKVPDLPGVLYHAMRYKCSFIMKEVRNRSLRRSKYGLPSFKRSIGILKTMTIRAKRRQQLRESLRQVAKEDLDLLKKRIQIVTSHFISFKTNIVHI
jgi:small subunit ribosomal protein S12